MDEPSDPTILVPIDISSQVHPNRALITLLHPARVIILGYYPVPDQAAPEQMRDQYEDEAAAQLESIVETFEDDAAMGDGILVFTRDRDASINRIAEEYNCDAVLTPGDVETVEHVLVPLRGDPHLDEIISFVEDLLLESDTDVTLFHGAIEDEDPTVSEFILRGATDRLVEQGFDRDRITWKQTETEQPVQDIITLAESHDIVVIGESDPTLSDHILGTIPSRILDRTGRPVLIVRAR